MVRLFATVLLLFTFTSTVLAQDDTGDEPSAQEILTRYSSYYQDFRNEEYEDAALNLWWMLDNAPLEPGNDDRNFRRAAQVYATLWRAARSDEDRVAYEDTLRLIVHRVDSLREAHPDAEFDVLGWQEITAWLGGLDASENEGGDDASNEPRVIRTFEGSGTTTTEPFDTGGPWEIQYESEGRHLFVHGFEAGYDDSVYPGQLASQEGAGTGQSYVDRGGRFYLRVIANGPWRIEVVEH